MKIPRTIKKQKNYEHCQQYGGETVLSGVGIFVENTLNQIGNKTGFTFINAFGNRVYVNTRSRTKAQKIVNDFYGAGRYTVSSTNAI